MEKLKLAVKQRFMLHILTECAMMLQTGKKLSLKSLCSCYRDMSGKQQSCESEMEAIPYSNWNWSLNWRRILALHKLDYCFPFYLR